MAIPADGGTFAAERELSNFRVRTIVGLLLFFACFMILFWFFCKSGYWDLKEIQVTGNREVTQVQIQEVVEKALDQRKAWRPWRTRNLLLMETDPLATQVKETFFAESVYLEKQFPNVLRLIMVERRRSFLIVTDGQESLVDSNGVVTKTDSSTRWKDLNATKSYLGSTDLPIFKSTLTEPLTQGYQVMPADSAKKLLTTYLALIGRGFKMRYVDLKGVGYHEMRLATDKPYMVIINGEEDLEPQLKRLEIFLKGMTKKMEIKEYIDVRVAGKIFYK